MYLINLCGIGRAIYSFAFICIHNWCSKVKEMKAKEIKEIELFGRWLFKFKNCSIPIEFHCLFYVIKRLFYQGNPRC